MCEKCLEKYAALDPEIVTAAEANRVIFSEFMKGMTKLMPDQLIKMTMMNPDGELVEDSDVPDEIKDQLKGVTERYQRAITAAFNAGFMGFRDAEDPMEMMILSIAISDALKEGAEYGSLCRTKARMGAH